MPSLQDDFLSPSGLAPPLTVPNGRRGARRDSLLAQPGGFEPSITDPSFRRHDDYPDRDRPRDGRQGHEAERGERRRADRAFRPVEVADRAAPKIATEKTSVTPTPAMNAATTVFSRAPIDHGSQSHGYPAGAGSWWRLRRAKTAAASATPTHA